MVRKDPQDEYFNYGGISKMKVVILCGGVGSRLAEETKLIPKPWLN